MPFVLVLNVCVTEYKNGNVKRASPQNSTVRSLNIVGCWFFCWHWCRFVVIHLYKAILHFVRWNHIYACTMYTVQCTNTEVILLIFLGIILLLPLFVWNARNLILILSNMKKNAMILLRHTFFASCTYLAPFRCFHFYILHLFILSVWPYLSAFFGVPEIEIMLIFSPANFWSDDLILVYLHVLFFFASLWI